MVRICNWFRMGMLCKVISDWKWAFKGHGKWWLGMQKERKDWFG